MLGLRTGAGVLAAVLMSAAAISGCSSGKAAQPSTTPAPAAAPSPIRTTHPFTGGTAGLKNPVLAVKIDNTRAAHPQLGVRSADIVYVEQVEGGLTRLMAIFSSRYPARLGPVRSARISDLHILRQFGKPAFAYSGANTKLLRVIARAPLYDLAPDSGRAGRAYWRQPGRAAPFDMFANPRALANRASQASRPRDLGWVFGAAPQGGTPVAKRITVRYPAARFALRWSASQRRWLVWQDGRPDRAAEGGVLGGQTVVIQYAKTTRSGYGDKFGGRTPLIHTTGTGKAYVLRDGMVFKTTWSRPNETAGTTFTTQTGERMTFAPGQVWVFLVKPGKPKIV